MFERIAAEFTALAAQLGLQSVEVIPVSALEGDNVVEPSAAMPWYTGPTLLEYLETVPLRTGGEWTGRCGFRCSLWCGPTQTFAASPGRSSAAKCAPGMRVMALPSGAGRTVKQHRDLRWRPAEAGGSARV